MDRDGGLKDFKERSRTGGQVPRAGIQSYLFSPESMIWRVSRETVSLLGGGRALLMQLAHPAVAAGVAGHSRFRDEPLRRLWRTMDTMWSIVFGGAAEAQRALQRVSSVHERVRGTLVDGDSVKAYDARDPRLLLWVHATLVDSALVTYDRFVRPLSPDEKRDYYEDMKRFGALFDIPEAMMPSTLSLFYAYMAGMIGGGELVVGETARGLAKDILHPRPWVLRAGGPLQSLITTGLLPARLRAAYGLDWNPRKEKMIRFVASVIRCGLPFAPSWLRAAPHARAAEKKLRRAGRFSVLRRIA